MADDSHPASVKSEKEIIRIDDSTARCTASFNSSISCLNLKDRDQMEKIEEEEDCFMLGFDPYHLFKLSLYDHDPDTDDDDDLVVIAEKGLVACRDFPHPRYACAKYPFEETPHFRHCQLCYCYVCDSVAPCSQWIESAGHCHAFSSDFWNNERENRRK